LNLVGKYSKRQLVNNLQNGHNVTIHVIKIESNVFIGMDSTLLGDAVIIGKIGWSVCKKKPTILIHSNSKTTEIYTHLVNLSNKKK